MLFFSNFAVNRSYLASKKPKTFSLTECYIGDNIYHPLVCEPWKKQKKKEKKKERNERLFEVTVKLENYGSRPSAKQVEPIV